MIRPPPRSPLFPYPPLSRPQHGVRPRREPRQHHVGLALLRDGLRRQARREQAFARPLQHRPLVRPTRLARSEEHTSELQSRLHLVCRLLLEKKKKDNIYDPP